MNCNVSGGNTASVFKDVPENGESILLQHIANHLQNFKV
jgi:hypothetical protein